jgi:restriction system protein
MATKNDLPPFASYFVPTIKCLKAKGGSTTIQEMEDDVASAIALSDELRAILHGEGPLTQFGYELAWVRTYLKKVGALDNSERGVWRLTPLGGSHVGRRNSQCA